MHRSCRFTPSPCDEPAFSCSWHRTLSVSVSYTKARAVAGRMIAALVPRRKKIFAEKTWKGWMALTQKKGIVRYTTRLRGCACYRGRKTCTTFSNFSARATRAFVAPGEQWAMVSLQRWHETAAARQQRSRNTEVGAARSSRRVRSARRRTRCLTPTTTLGTTCTPVSSTRRRRRRRRRQSARVASDTSLVREVRSRCVASPAALSHPFRPLILSLHSPRPRAATGGHARPRRASSRPPGSSPSCAARDRRGRTCT